MILLRGAERSRRTAVACALVALSAGQALHPHPTLAATTAALLRPLDGLFLRLAAECDALFASRPAGEAVGAPRASLASVERARGQPPEVAGVYWLEVPVVEADRARGELLLAAGSEHGLAGGQPVAFGSVYLGRLSDLAPGSARVRLVDGAAVRTGVRVRPAPELEGYRAVALGRQAGDAPVVELLEGDARPFDGHAVEWRPGPEESDFEGAGLRIGLLTREGDPERGRAAWTVAIDRPAGAEGRVWVALPGGEERVPLADREVLRSGAWRLLRADAVLGPGVPAVLLDAPLPGAVLLSGDRVVGELVVTVGRAAWVRRRGTAAWGAAAVGVVAGTRILTGDRTPDGEVALYTRGDARVPRGLWIGAPSEPPAPLADPLVACALAPQGP